MFVIGRFRTLARHLKQSAGLLGAACSKPLCGTVTGRFVYGHVSDGSFRSPTTKPRSIGTWWKWRQSRSTPLQSTLDGDWKPLPVATDPALTPFLSTLDGDGSTVVVATIRWRRSVMACAWFWPPWWPPRLRHLAFGWPADRRSVTLSVTGREDFATRQSKQKCRQRASAAVWLSAALP